MARRYPMFVQRSGWPVRRTAPELAMVFLAIRRLTARQQGADWRQSVLAVVVLLTCWLSGGQAAETQTLKYNNGDTYVGEVRDGERHGQGTYTSSDGREYVGMWYNNQRQGQGTMT